MVVQASFFLRILFFFQFASAYSSTIWQYIQER